MKWRDRLRRIKRFRTKHHLTPRERYKDGIRTPWGQDSDANILALWNEHHIAWHQLFKNRTLEEIIAVLTRVAQAKHRRQS